MELIDEDGNLFGLVNVIDLLVVLFAAAVIIGGAALLLSETSGDPEIRYATIDLGEQPSHVISAIEPGDVMEVEGSADSLTITDTYVGPGDDGHLIVRAAVRGQRVAIGEVRHRFEFAGAPFRPGRQLTIETPAYEATGNVTRVDAEGETVATTTTDVGATATVPTEVATELAVGDVYAVDETTIATIEAVQIYPGEEDRQTAVLGLSLSTYDRGGTPHFGANAVRIGEDIPFETDMYDLTATVRTRGSHAIETSAVPVVIDATVNRTIREAIEVGDSVGLGDEPIATVESITAYPTADRDRDRLILGVTLQATEGNRGLHFAGEPLRVGTTIPVHTAEYELSGEVIVMGTLDEPGDPTTTEVTLQLRDVRPERAERIEVGMTETIDGETLAEITDKSVEPATVILESDAGNIYEREHPRNLDVELTVELRTRETATTLRFHGSDLREGDEIVLDLGRATVSGEVVAIHD